MTDPFFFITGGTGNTGARLVSRLLNEGRRVRCLSRTRERRAFLPVHENLEIVEGDIGEREIIPGREPEWLEKIRGAGTVLHLAHIGFADSIVTACEKARVPRFICLSSTRRFTKFPEETARRVIEGEARIEASPLEYTILRPSMIYGGGRDNNTAKIIQWLKRVRLMPLIGGGRNLVQPIYVDDLVEAILRAIQRHAGTSRNTLTLAGPNPLSWKRMIELTGEAAGRPPLWIPVPYGAAMGAVRLAGLLPGFSWATPDQVRRLLEDKTFDIEPARRALGCWTPRGFEEGIRLAAKP